MQRNLKQYLNTHQTHRQTFETDSSLSRLFVHKEKNAPNMNSCTQIICELPLSLSRAAHFVAIIIHYQETMYRAYTIGENCTRKNLFVQSYFTTLRGIPLLCQKLLILIVVSKWWCIIIII